MQRLHYPALWHNLVLGGVVVTNLAVLHTITNPAATEAVSNRSQISTSVDVRTHRDQIWRAICAVESNHNPAAIGDRGDSWGIAQISSICLEDCNRIAGQQWTEQDRFSPARSREMFEAYVGHYEPDGDAEAIARLWNSGPKWRTKMHLTESYWQKVKSNL